jgi:predicted sugar kinase
VTFAAQPSTCGSVILRSGEGVRRIACLEEAEKKDDATVGRRGLCSGHGVGDAHRLGMVVPGGQQ